MNPNDAKKVPDWKDLVFYGFKHHHTQKEIKAALNRAGYTIQDEILAKMLAMTEKMYREHCMGKEMKEKEPS